MKFRLLNNFSALEKLAFFLNNLPIFFIIIADYY